MAFVRPTARFPGDLLMAASASLLTRVPFALQGIAFGLTNGAGAACSADVIFAAQSAEPRQLPIRIQGAVCASCRRVRVRPGWSAQIMGATVHHVEWGCVFLVGPVRTRCGIYSLRLLLCIWRLFSWQVPLRTLLMQPCSRR